MTTTTFTRENLERLSAIETPETIPQGIRYIGLRPLVPYHGGRGGDFQDFCYNYIELRNSAKDLLTNPGDREAQERLNRLMVELKVKLN